MMTAVLLALGLAGFARAADEDKTAPLDRKVLDQRVHTTLRDIIDRGATLFNSDDRAGCYRLYEGSLIMVQPLLDHRPHLQKAIDEGLARAKSLPTYYERAFALREVLDKIRDDIVPRKKSDGTAQPPLADKTDKTDKGDKTLWDRLGGEANVKKVVDDFVDLASTNPKVNFDRDGKYKLDPATVARLKKLLVEQISSLTGGPFKYSGRDMKTVHKDMAITDAEFDALAADLKTALERNGAKAADVQAVLALVAKMKPDIVESKKANDK
jgi:hemoglobin